MKKFLCGLLSLILCFACMSSFAENDDESAPVIVIVDIDTTNPEPEDENNADEETSDTEQEPVSDYEDEDESEYEDEAGDETGDEVNEEDSEESTSEPSPEPSPEPTSEPELPPEWDGTVTGVRWTYPVSMTALQTDFLVLANAENLLDKSYKPKKLVKVSGVKRATSAAIYLEETAAKALKEMFEGAKSVTSYTYTAQTKKGEEEKEATFEGGMVLYLKSGHRSYGTQVTTYNNYLARNNNVDDGYVAKPGASEHQTGLSADILNADYAGRPRMTQDFKWTPEAQWMKENCIYYGFILRYTEDEEEKTGIRFEPWHFRYVGKEVAGYIHANDFTLEEFTEQWQAALDEFLAKGGSISEQLAYEYNRRNAPPESHILDEIGEDGDNEVSLEF